MVQIQAYTAEIPAALPVPDGGHRVYLPLFLPAEQRLALQYFVGR